MAKTTKRPARHGTVTRYRQGCHCPKCRKANTDKRREQREKKRAADEAAEVERQAAAVTQLRDHLKAVPDLDDDTEVEPESRPVEVFSVFSTLTLALDEVKKDDAVTRLYKAQALNFATILDHPGYVQQWKGISESLARVLTHLIVAAPPGEQSGLQAVVEAIRGGS